MKYTSYKLKFLLCASLIIFDMLSMKAAYFLPLYFKMTVYKWRSFCKTANGTPI